MSKCVNYDIEDTNGLWKKSIKEDGVKFITLSYLRWRGIINRCKENGFHQIRCPSYKGTSNSFKGFQEFVEWSRKQVGYDFEGYDLDKDLLIRGNKIYGPDTCVFLPERINLLLIKSNAIRGKYPIGVCFDKYSSKFRAKCSNGTGIQKNLGHFKTPEEAFYAYKEFKENLIKQVAEEYKDVIDIRAYNALKSYQVEITD